MAPILSSAKLNFFKETENDERSDVYAYDAEHDDAKHDGHAVDDATVDDGGGHDANDAGTDDPGPNDDAKHDGHAVDDADDDGQNEVHNDSYWHDLRDDANGRVFKSNVHGILQAHVFNDVDWSAHDDELQRHDDGRLLISYCFGVGHDQIKSGFRRT
jgi:hypothetical protein